MIRVLAGLAALAAFLSFGTPAAAELELCNRTSYIVYAATAVQEKDSVTAQGWTRVIPGDCTTAIAAPLSKLGYFVYARTSAAHGGPSRDWGGDTRLCALSVSFRLKSPIGTIQCAADASALPFAQIKTGGKSVWTTTFTESKDLSTADAARTAGLKRLLRDNGAKIVRIDGKPDKQTGGALSNFRGRMHMAPGGGTRDMFDALETEALKTAAPAGYSVCNDTDGDVWTVIAFRQARDWVTRGWWKVAAGSCAKAITTPLAFDTIYLHAERHGNPKLVSGADKFCLTNMQFEVEGRGNCSKRGLSEAGFVATTTKGLAGYAAHIGNKGLIAPMVIGKQK
jgi:uncharacterized membrane protein